MDECLVLDPSDLQQGDKLELRGNLESIIKDEPEPTNTHREELTVTHREEFTVTPQNTHREELNVTQKVLNS